MLLPEGEEPERAASLAPLAPDVSFVKPAAPAFSFGRAASRDLPFGKGGHGRGGEGAAAGEDDEWGEGMGSGGEESEDGEWWDDEPHERRYALTERRGPAATFGSAPRFGGGAPPSGSKEEGGRAHADPCGVDAEGEAPLTPPRRTVRGGAIGRAPRFPGDKEASRQERDAVPFSPTASTVLSDAATDIASLSDVEGASSRLRRRAPSALIMPERTAPISSRQARQAIAAARLGPGSYSVSTDFTAPRAPGASFGPRPKEEAEGGAALDQGATPATQARSRRRAQLREGDRTPGPGAYASTGTSSVRGAAKPSGAAWSKMSGREPTAAAAAAAQRRAAQAASGEQSAAASAPPPKGRSAAATVAAARAVAKKFALPSVPEAADALRRRPAAARFGTAARDTPFGRPPTSGADTAGVPFYEVRFAAVERGLARFGSFAKGETGVDGRSVTRKAPLATRRIELLRNWRLRRQQLERLIKGGDFGPAAATMGPPLAKAPADAVRPHIPGFAYRAPTAVAPRHPGMADPRRRHRAVSPQMVRESRRLAQTNDLVALHHKWLRVRPESYSFGRASQYDERQEAGRADEPGPFEYGFAAAEARLELGFLRAPVAAWGRMRALRFTGPHANADHDDDEDGGPSAREEADGGADEDGGGASSRSAAFAKAYRRRLARERAREGDVLVLENVLAAQFYSRPLRVALPGFRMLLPSASPRRALVPRPPFPPPPLAPVLLLPPSRLKHVPSVHLAPRLHRPRHRVGDWGWAGLPPAPPASVDAEYLTIEEVDTASMRTYRSTPGGSFGHATRFEVITAAASLLPEGCVLELHPSYDLVLPHHGVLVNMKLSAPIERGPPTPSPIELLEPNPGTYDLSRALAVTKPSAPATDFGRAPNPRADELLVGGGGGGSGTFADEPSAATYDAATAWLAHIVGRRAPQAFFGTETRPVGADADAAAAKGGGGILGEGELLLLLSADAEGGPGSRATGRPMRHDGTGGAIPLRLQVGRLPPPSSGEHEVLSGGDYDADDSRIRRRWPVVDFGSAPERPDLFPTDPSGGQMLDLDPLPDAVLPRAPCVDFHSAPERDAPRGDGADHTPDALGQLLELYPRPEAVMPSHPTSVVMRRDPNQPRQRPRRWPVVRSEQDRLLDSIELALAEAPPPGDFWDETGGSRQL